MPLQISLLLPMTIAGLGVREASLIAFCAAVGIPSDGAVAWSLTILAGTLCVALAGGVLEFLPTSRRGATPRVDGGREP